MRVQKKNDTGLHEEKIGIGGLVIDDIKSDSKPESDQPFYQIQNMEKLKFFCSCGCALQTISGSTRSLLALLLNFIA